MKTNENIEKARSGVYEDTSENRRKHRVGQRYGQEASAQEEGDEKKSKRAERLERLKKYQNQLAQIKAKTANAKTEEEKNLGKDLEIRVREKMEKLAARLGVDPYKDTSKETFSEKKSDINKEKVLSSAVKKLAERYVNFLNGEDESQRFNDSFEYLLKEGMSREAILSEFRRVLPSALSEAGIQPEEAPYYAKEFEKNLSIDSDSNSKPENPWPDDVDKMKRTVDWQTLEAAERKLIEAELAHKYGDEEGLFNYLMEKNSWDKERYDSYSTEEEKNHFKEETIRDWVNRQIGSLRGGYRRSDRLSVTARIEQLKNRYKRIADEKEKARQEAAQEEYLKTDEGISRRREFESKKEQLSNEFSQNEKSSKDRVISEILSLDGIDFTQEEIEKIHVSVNREALLIRGISDSGWDDVQIHYRSKSWNGDGPKKYTVDVKSFNDVEPEDKKTLKAIAVQLSFLTNSDLIEKTKSIIDDYDKTLMEIARKRQELKKEYGNILSSGEKKDW